MQIGRRRQRCSGRLHEECSQCYSLRVQKASLLITKVQEPGAPSGARHRTDIRTAIWRRFGRDDFHVVPIFIAPTSFPFAPTAKDKFGTTWKSFLPKLRFFFPLS